MKRRILILLPLAALVFGILPLLGASAGGYCHMGGNTMAKSKTVDMKGNCYSPTVVQIPAGGKVTWTNSDPETHMVLGVGGSWGGTHEMAPGESATMRFNNPGVFPYWCHLHLGMVGAVVVGDGTSGPRQGGGPVATTVATSSAGDDGSATVGVTPARASRAPQPDGGVTPMAVAGIAALTGVAGFGLAHRRLRSRAGG